MSTAVRKVVTVLFCDVVEFTTLGEELDPERLRHVMTRFFAEMESVLGRHGGTVEKFIGDEVMAVFGVPTVHEDDALRAVRSAAEMMERLDPLNDELAEAWGVQLQIRIGVNTGEVVAGDPSRGHGFVTGDAVNLAKRLESAAEPGQILIGKATYPLVRHAVTVGPLQTFKVKGKADAVSSLRIDAVDFAAEAVARRLDAPLVGRDDELRALREAFERAARTPGCELVTLTGVPGIGKSRLVSELVGGLADHARILRGRCLAYGDGITFWPLADVVRALGGAEAVHAALAGDEDGREVAARVLGAVGGSEPGSAEETFWAVRRLVEALAREQPLVLVLEDVHWAEQRFLDLVEYLATWTSGAPTLLVCVARPELLDLRPTWLAPRPNSTLISLEPLSHDAADELLTRLAGEAELPPEARRTIAEAAEGNPLFVEQMLAMAREGGDISVPPTIQALLAERLDRLSGDERALLERASVAGRDFLRRAVIELSPPEERDRVGGILMSLIRRGLVRPTRERDPREDAYTFRHGLIRDTAYDGISKEARADLHERFATWLEAFVEANAAEVEEIVGYHLEQAYRYREQLGPVGERERALASRAGDLLGHAGRRAFGRDDMPAAIKLLDRAVALMTEEEPARLELVRELSSGLWAIGEVARAEALLEGLIVAASAAGDRRIEWYGLLERAARADHVKEQSELLDLAEQAIQVFGELGDDDGLAAAWRRVAAAHEAHNRYRLSQEASEHGLAAARRAGNRKEEARAVDRLCTSLLAGPEPAPAAIRRCEQMLERADGNKLFEANVAIPLAGLRAMAGELDAARELYAHGERIYEQLGLVLPIAGSTYIAATIELLAADPVAAERHLRRGYDIFAATGLGRLLGFQAAYLAEALRVQRRLAEAEAFADEAETSASSHDLLAQVMWRTARSRLHREHGRVGDALRVAEAAVDIARDTEAPVLHADALLALADALAADGRAADAVAAARSAARLYAAKGHRVGEERATRFLMGIASTA